MLQMGFCRVSKSSRFNPEQSSSGIDLYRPSGTGPSTVALTALFGLGSHS
jgi:hypothetical protein